MFESPHAILIARYILGAAKSWELPEVADAFINDGPGTPALAELATMRNPTMAEAGPLFERVLHERGVHIPSREEAIWTLLTYYVRSIADGSVMPQQGLGLVVNEVYYPGRLYERSTAVADDSYHIDALIGAWYEYDDLFKSDDIRSLNTEVMRIAQEWIKEHGNK